MIRHRIIFVLSVSLCISCVWYVVYTYANSPNLQTAVGSAAVSEYGWVIRLLYNGVGYATVLLPLWVMYKYLNSVHYFDKPVTSSCTSRVLFLCYGDNSERLPDTNKLIDETSPTEVSEKVRGVRLAGCFVGLMGAYLVWGLLQEKIMTQNYILSDGSAYKFSDSQFLVFINRLAAFVLSVCRVCVCDGSGSGGRGAAAPLYKFSFCALTNIVSAWCQYEALKYVSFPTQVLSKSCKVIPVMLMGRLVSGNRYELWEYLSAALISVGMVLFMMTSTEHVSSSAVTTLSGLVLLAVYLCCDSFTSSWQGQLFKQYQMSPLHMLCYVNMFSCLLTATSLLQHAATVQSVALLQHPMFLLDCTVLALASCVGQTLIYYTIKHYGAVLFTVIMTLRQAASILLSCIVFDHRLSAAGMVGVLLVLVAVFMRLYCRKRCMQKQAALLSK